MNIKSYLNLYELLENDNSTKEQRRTFGLASTYSKSEPIKQLLEWIEANKHKLKEPTLSQYIDSYLYGITLTLTIVAFILGVFSSIAMLSYSGDAPVNVIYFMAMVIFVPLFTMFLTSLAMISATSMQSVLVHISPTFWMQKVLSYFFKDIKIDIQLDKGLVNWVILKRSQLLALSFSFGLLFTLLFIVATKDLAFAWSTTINIEPKAFYNFLNVIAYPWRDLFPWAVPSLELIEQSHYYRLGEKLSSTMVDSASLLGEWWKFLLFATLFYAIFLRFILLLLSSIGFKKALKNSFLTLKGSNKLLTDMNEVIITTIAKEKESSFHSSSVEYNQLLPKLKSSYDVTLGWSIDREKIMLLSESMNLTSTKTFELGGSNSLDEDILNIEECYGEALIFVKSWEPPTMDFMDSLDMLLEKIQSVTIVPIGTETKAYKVDEKKLNIWARKLLGLNSKKVWLKV